ncbi:MAG: hypothetical protein WCF20_03140 [Methylovirgula sp.]
MQERMSDGIVNRVVRSFRGFVLPFVLPVILALFALPADAQENPFVGQWSANFSGFILNYVMEPNFH